MQLIYKQHTLIGTCGLLVMFIIITFIYGIKQWKEDWALTHGSIASMNAPTVNQIDRLASSIIDAHLFGKSITNGNVPLSSLQLLVTGIVSVNHEQNNPTSKVYISIAHQVSKIYQVGDLLPYGVRVYAINDNAVILENDGHFEKLLLPREKLQFKAREEEKLND